MLKMFFIDGDTLPLERLNGFCNVEGRLRS
jgi:hypothetical protein